ncbi:mps one binder kinase activator-like 1 [Tritrichomonas foetus]|uniref:Mps one binder kinase activator-like 1 n=1 Tax=Tritrichomonas foetus TaxID=1144522 RepID=A0A1J4KEK6_9EUKA|nr:mps one binder kinase activator-like 1 [Tritrichomonas foetus]|eukprot:OHT09879.1 mps one binder kinase activator-like 1 [Tritrichomonas foetus]
MYCLLQHKRATLNAGDFTESIKKPQDTDINDWFAANIVDFYNEMQIVVEDVIKHCTEEKCPKMSAGPKYQYLWKDNERYKTPTLVPAHLYIELLFNWIDELLDDQSVFPSDSLVPFPKNFKDIIKQISKRLFRVYAHIYYHHLEDVRNAGVEPHFNTAFRHFYAFISEFKLVPPQEIEPLNQVIQSFSNE